MLGSIDDIAIAPRREKTAEENDVSTADVKNNDAIAFLKNREKTEEEKQAERAKKYEEAQDAQKRLRRLRDSQKKSQREILNVVLSVEEKKRLEKLARKYEITQRAFCQLAITYFLDLVEKEK
jgi:hypothetical protein